MDLTLTGGAGGVASAVRRRRTGCNAPHINPVVVTYRWVPMRAREFLSSAVISLVSLAAASAATPSAAGPVEPTAADPAGGARYIVRAANLRSARQDIVHVGASVQQNLPIINAASAYLDPRQAARLRKTAGVHVFEDRSLTTEGTGLLGLLSPVTAPVLTVVSSLTPPTDGTGELLPTLLYQTNYPMRVGADTLQQAGITGKGVTIAVLDSGLWQDPMQNYASRLLATINVVNGGSSPVTGDAYGHGTHVTSIAAGGAMNLSGNYLSIAPKANVVEVQAFDSTGGARYADVISGLNWIVA